MGGMRRIDNDNDDMQISQLDCPTTEGLQCLSNICILLDEEDSFYLSIHNGVYVAIMDLTPSWETATHCTPVTIN